MIFYDPNQIQIENTNSYLETVKKTTLFFTMKVHLNRIAWFGLEVLPYM